MFLTIRRNSYAECILMLQRLAMSSHSLPFAVLQMSWKCELICIKESQMTNAIPIVRTAF